MPKRSPKAGSANLGPARESRFYCPRTARIEGKHHVFSQVMRVTELTITKGGQILLVPEEQIIKLHQDHGTSEQFHGEFKTDLDLERLPSGKFATNSLVMSLATMAYNILRLIGQAEMLGEQSPVQHPAKRQRIKTVMQGLICLASRLIRTGRRLKKKFGRNCDGFAAFSLVHELLLT